MTADPIALPGVGPDLPADLTAWAHDDIWAELVAGFGGDPHQLPEPTSARLGWLDTFSDRWDARHGHLERDQADALPLAQSQVELVQRAADRLGMRAPQPPRFRQYDHVLALGGLIRACFIRPAHAAHLLESGQVSTGSVIGLGGHRPFSAEEAALAAQAGLVDVDSEFTALDAGVRTAFGLGRPVAERGELVSSPGGSWSVREYRTAAGMPVTVAAAPSSEPERRRANTADSYVWMAEELARLQPGQRLLAVTTAIYVPAQHAAAVATLGLPYGVVVDTVGTDPAAIDPLWDQQFSPTRYLMEFRSAVRAMRRLEGLINDPTGRGNW